MKKLVDILAASLLIIITFPIMFIIGVAIKIESRGPVLYKSKRVGKYGKLFTFLKFRSMYTHLSVGYGGKEAEDLYNKLIQSDANIRQGVLPKIHNDPRVTRVGRFIRKTSLDELPQFFCVVRGTMSLVGPRPHLPNEVKNYESRQKRLLSIRPGITGYAQVFGRDNLDFDEEAKLDLYYIQNRSLFLDVYIILATF
jgi:lipopolysaccharide/colanic/teichoic acid biosynthesis glycosyltransferase